MDEIKKNIKAHLFVCTSCTFKKADGSESLPEEAHNLRKSLKTKAYERFGKEHVRVSSVGCLSECANGIATVMYPNCSWKINVRPENEEQLLDQIANVINN